MLKQNVDQGALQEIFTEVIHRKAAGSPNELGQLVLRLTAVVAKQHQALHGTSEADARIKAIQIAHEELKAIERKGYVSGT